MDGRLPAHIEVSGLVRAVTEAGGFATIVHKGERDAGTVLIVTRHRDEPLCLYERVPNLQGKRVWTETRQEPAENEQKLSEYLQKRADQDPDCWIIDLEIAQVERFIG